MSTSDKETSPPQKPRPACMPSNKEDGLLPPISFRGTPSSDSDSDCRRTGLSSSNENSSLSSSPVKLPSIGRSFSTSVSSLTTGQSKDRTDKREILCRSPSCPSSIGLIHETFDKRDNKQKKQHPVLEDEDIKLPCIFQDRKSSVTNYATPRNITRNRSNSHGRKSFKSCDQRTTVMEDERRTSFVKPETVVTPRDGSSLDTYRSTTQCALLLPLRNSETRKSKRKRRSGHFRQNTQLSVKSESGIHEDVGKEKIVPSSRSEYNAYSPVRELDPRILSESDDLNSDVSSEGNTVHPTYHVTKHSNKHQIRMKDLAHVKA